MQCSAYTARTSGVGLHHSATYRHSRNAMWGNGSHNFRSLRLAGALLTKAFQLTCDYIKHACSTDKLETLLVPFYWCL